MNAAGISIIGALISAGLGAWAMIYVGRMARRTGQDSNDWERIQGLWRRVDALETKVKDLDQQNGQQGQELQQIREENDRHTRKIANLERALDAARRYVQTLIAQVHALGGTPTDPPADYIDD